MSCTRRIPAAGGRRPSPWLAALTVLLVPGLARCAAPDEAIPEGFTRQDWLRGSVTPERAWWDLLHYDLALEVDPDRRHIQGSNTITFRAEVPGTRMQLDLQHPLEITRVVHAGAPLSFEREGDVYWVRFPEPVPAGAEARVQVFYGGQPVESRNPPWSGGFTWTEDDAGNPFIATTCQGVGASIWWPCKDHGADEPDRGVDVRVTVPAALTAVSNGRLVGTTADAPAGTRTFHWRVQNPINNYCVNVNIGAYASERTVYQGEAGPLDVEYWVLEHHRDQALRWFRREVPRTLAALEHWFGPYPFPEDSYKLVEVPYLGMEHQSSVTYGNGFQNGYRGRDLSGSGAGLKFDFIIVHESAHEWFGNNVSMQDAADMWIHESFANYAENLFVEYHFTEQEAQDYVIGCRRLVRHDRPVAGTPGVNHRGSGDMYYKGGNLLHTLRHALGDDARWRGILRGLNQEFRHRTVTTAQVEEYLTRETGLALGPFFDQYLRGTGLPVLAWEPRADGVALWWEDAAPGFTLPVVVHRNGAAHRVVVSERPTLLDGEEPLETFEVDRNFYVQAEQRRGEDR